MQNANPHQLTKQEIEKSVQSFHDGLLAIWQDALGEYNAEQSVHRTSVGSSRIALNTLRDGLAEFALANPTMSIPAKLAASLDVLLLSSMLSEAYINVVSVDRKLTNAELHKIHSFMNDKMQHIRRSAAQIGDTL